MQHHKEVERLCIALQLADNKNVLYHSSKLAERVDMLEQKFNEGDIVKYLCCVDLVRRRLKISWDKEVANSLGAKHPIYLPTFNIILHQMDIPLAFTFEDVAKKISAIRVVHRCKEVFETFKRRKLEKLPLMQRHQFTFTREYKAACLICVARDSTMKIGKQQVGEVCEEFAISKQAFDLAKKEIILFCGAILGHKNSQTYRERTPEPDTESDECDEFNEGKITKRKKRKQDFNAWIKRVGPQKKQRTEIQIIDDDSSSEDNAVISKRVSPTKKKTVILKKKLDKPSDKLFPIFKMKRRPSPKDERQIEEQADNPRIRAANAALARTHELMKR